MLQGSAGKQFKLLLLGAVVLPVLLLAGDPVSPQGRGRSAALKGSKHDLTVRPSGTAGPPGADPCYFCHTPHTSKANARDLAPLWNRELPVTTYDTYTSSTLDAGMATLSQGVSKLCLSCHDGTVASGLGAGALDASLVDDHPVGFQPMDDGQLALSLFQRPPRTFDPAVKLVGGRIECTSCHDSHNPSLDPLEQKFLVRSNSGGALCLACHDPGRPQPNHLAGWSLSAHATASHSTVQPKAAGPYGTVSANACGSCHRSHNAPGAATRLQRGVEEETCGGCHGGQGVVPPVPDVMADFAKIYAHPTTAERGLHDPTENAFPLSENRHAECPDCHQPHSVQHTEILPVPPALPPALQGVSGFDGNSQLRPATREYEVCFKCHADSPNKPQSSPGYLVYGYTPRREAEKSAIDPKNLREKFASTIARHNVTQPRRRSNAEVPSLRPFVLYPNGSQGRSLAVGTYLYCTDCHASNDAGRSGGTGAEGPHGSVYPHILAARYEQEVPPTVPGRADGQGGTYIPGSDGSYALCNRCHDVVNSVLADTSFSGHRRHVVEEGASCATCHEPHGIHDAGGSPTQNPGMVSFDLNIVGPDSRGVLSIDGIARECSVSCHGEDHIGYRY